jgi:hypothetical protein
MNISTSYNQLVTQEKKTRNVLSQDAVVYHRLKNHLPQLEMRRQNYFTDKIY